MIILTQPNIKKFNPIRQSSIIEYAHEKYCLAEVENNFNISSSEMKKASLDFYWECGTGYFDCEKFIDTYNKKFKGGIIEVIEWIYGVSKEVNIASAIGSLSNFNGQDEFKLWEKMIE
ncbi:MAG: hypothetical protein ACOC56_03055 [Atribacterota bacterium]